MDIISFVSSSVILGVILTILISCYPAKSINKDNFNDEYDNWSAD